MINLRDYDGNLTDGIKKVYVDAVKMDEILTALPLTSRNVGKIPDGWLTNISEKDRIQCFDDICNAISECKQNKKIKILADKLIASSILIVPSVHISKVSLS